MVIVKKKTPEELAAEERERQIQEKSLKAGRNIGIDVKTGAEVPVIEMRGPREETFAKQFPPTSPEQQEQMFKARREQMIAEEIQRQEQIPIIPQPLPEATLKKPKASPAEIATTTGAGIIAGGAGAAGGAMLGAKGGALIGAVGGPAGAAIGAVAGGLIGGATAIITKISIERRQDAKEANAVFVDATANMEKIKGYAKEGFFSRSELWKMWDVEMINFYAAERNIKQLTKNEISAFLSDGRDEASGIEAFRRRIDNGSIEREFEMAILEGENKRIQAMLK